MKDARGRSAYGQGLRWFLAEEMVYPEDLIFGENSINRRKPADNFGQALIKLAAILAVTFFASGVQGAEIISGVPFVSNGDTMVVGATKIRLEGIDAPETDQVCLNAVLKRWTCGIEARDRLAAHIENRSIDCEPSGADAYGRTLAMCMLEDEDLNAWMVREGWALAFVRYSKAYVPDEEAARTAQRGIWSGTFIAPWDWLLRNKETVIQGATSVPISAQAILLAPVSADETLSPDCIIKGNVNHQGERIYFRPGQLDYAHVNMAKPGLRWFCTEDDAKAAGWHGPTSGIGPKLTCRTVKRMSDGSSNAISEITPSIAL
jgi:endonuclease YncB( thermonuclease family)